MSCMLRAIPEALAETDYVCSSVNVGSTKAGINMDAVALMGRVIQRDGGPARADRDGMGCAKLVVFCNAVEDNPFMAGAFHGAGEPDCVINVGVSGPGVVRARPGQSVRGLRPLTAVADTDQKDRLPDHPHGPAGGHGGFSPAWACPSASWICPWRPPRRWGTRVAHILEEMGLEMLRRATAPRRPWPCSTTR